MTPRVLPGTLLPYSTESNFCAPLCHVDWQMHDLGEGSPSNSLSKYQLPNTSGLWKMGAAANHRSESGDVHRGRVEY